MTVLVASVAALVLLCFGPAYYQRMIQAYAEEVTRLEREISAFELAKEEQEAELLALASEESGLAAERKALIEMEHALPSLGGAEEHEDPEAPKDAIGYLLKTGAITREDVDKARDYKTGSGSPYDLDEILVMLDVISSEAMKNARRRIG